MLVVSKKAYDVGPQGASRTCVKGSTAGRYASTNLQNTVLSESTDYIIPIQVLLGALD